jgi:hypothetical protein
MKAAYFDLIGGASGDMLLGALLDAGLPLEALDSGLQALRLPGYQLHAQKVSKNGFGATKVDVLVQDTASERHLSDILSLVQASSLPNHIIEQAGAVFQRIGSVEAGIHGVSLEKVHLHELGGIDTIVDVCGVLLGLELLGIEQVTCSPFPLGRGSIRGAHGIIPLPSPATLALLQGAPITGSEIEKELVTPTGAALLTHLSTGYGPIPSMTLQTVGYGAGGRDLPVPNLVRLLVGEQTSPGSAVVETLVMLETNIDDLNPQIYDHLLQRLLAAQALDVTFAPVQMKKNRPGTLVSVLCQPAQANALQAILFSETSTLGVRRSTVERHALPRRFVRVQTPYGEVQIKVAEYAPGNQRPVPEYEDCRKLAAASGAPLWEIQQAALRAYGEMQSAAQS